MARQAFRLLKQGIRINAICPGPTDTPLAQANAEMWLGFGADYREEAGTEASTPLEQAYPLVFLCSDAAAAITGITLITDVGYISSGITGSFPPATAAADFLLGRLQEPGRRGDRLVSPAAGLTATEGMLALAPQRRTRSTDADELVDLHQRSAQEVALLPDRVELGQQLHVPIVGELGHRVALAAGAVAHDDPGEADPRMLGTPRLDQVSSAALLTA